MGILKEGLRRNVETLTESGNEVTENANERLREAEISVEALNSLECIDDDDREAADTGRSEAMSISAGIAESQIDYPTSELANQYAETSREASEYAGIEHSDAAKAGGLVSDYSGVGANLAASFEASAVEFEGIAAESDSSSSNLQARNTNLSNALRGIFG